jgi:hypothetical protein
MYNKGKLTVAAAMFILGGIMHKERHFLEEDEKKDTSYQRNLSSHVPLFMQGFLSFAVAVGWVLGVNAFSKPWTMAEIASALLAFGALLLRQWCFIALQKYFTYTIGLRKDHK